MKEEGTRTRSAGNEQSNGGFADGHERRFRRGWVSFPLRLTRCFQGWRQLAFPKRGTEVVASYTRRKRGHTHMRKRRHIHIMHVHAVVAEMLRLLRVLASMNVILQPLANIPATRACEQRRCRIFLPCLLPCANEKRLGELGAPKAMHPLVCVWWETHQPLSLDDKEPCSRSERC